ncbi:hypothetical protein LSUB1_G005030 [Lachnellula subtilissima]|uniref:F-box domain-containing protein n=1 Tax=Lachnellula subtilissima TaxID=602034 RepID=A0A8H8UCM9_9HELO|nr:hypothetical protein LSUB1_G005030 [Lachnellula subtilissima]
MVATRKRLDAAPATSSAALTRQSKRKAVQEKKTSKLAPIRQSKRKAVLETEEKRASENAASGKSRKRVKKELPSYLQKSYQAENGPNHNVQLLNLPREIFDGITSLLEPEALTCLSLTCKEILSFVGTESWLECRPRRRGWDYDSCNALVPLHRLFTLLVRDVPHLVYCAGCAVLHPPLRPPREHRKTKLTNSCFGPFTYIDYTPIASGIYGGYSLVWEHIMEARKLLTLDSGDKPGPLIELLGGNFTIPRERLTHTMNSSGRQIGKHLVLKHEHVFRGTSPRSPLRVADIIDLKIRLCPHQTTSTQKAEPGRYTKTRLPCGLLCHSIATAAPLSIQAGIPAPSMFCTPTPSEKKQMDSTVPGVSTLWTCRACPTKWHVQYDGQGAGQFKITTWQSFGDTAYRAQQYWKMLVRREMSNLAADKRNSEFFISNKQYLDFRIDDR